MTLVLDKPQLARVVRTLEKAGDVDTSPAVQKALKEGANRMKVAGQANLAARNKEHTGNLKRSFKIKVTRRKKIGRNYALTGFKRGKGGGNHAHMIDYGTARRYTKRGYTDVLKRTYPAFIYRGKVTGTRFWRDAVNSEGPAALNNIVNVIERELSKMMG